MSHLRHPKGLYVLFLTEMWERFSFYGLKALLVLYLVQAKSWTDTEAFSLFGAYAALVYATPVLGGYIADRFLGFKKAILLGGVMITLGHFSLAMHSVHFFYTGLALVVCGTGYLKSCISGLVGELYQAGDRRRDSGFTIFYMGINLGAFLAGFSVGIVAKVWGWHYGFGLAGVGMLLGLLTFVLGHRTLEHVGNPPSEARYEWLIGLCSFACVPLVSWLISQSVLVGWLLVFTVIISVFMVVQLGLRCEPNHRRRLLALMILFVFAVGFWSLFEQSSSSITLFTERGVDRHFWGTVIPTPAFQSLNPLYILVLAPVFALLWIQLAKVNREPSTPIKFMLGMVLVVLGFGVLFVSTWITGVQEPVWVGWLGLAYLLHTLGELCLSPAGLSAVTRLSPKGSVGTMMGVWFLAMSTSNYLAAFIAKFTVVETLGSVDYAQGFLTVFSVGAVITLFMMMTLPLLTRLMLKSSSN